MNKKRVYDGLATRIQNLRIYNGLTQKELADKTSMTREAIARTEEGLTTPHEYNLENIAKTLNTTTNYLKYGEE